MINMDNLIYKIRFLLQISEYIKMEPGIARRTRASDTLYIRHRQVMCGAADPSE